ncbi:MAG: hypothetical protein WC645_05370 [Candidatus Margulisiibacteriota bacterium]
MSTIKFERPLLERQSSLPPIGGHTDEREIMRREYRRLTAGLHNEFCRRNPTLDSRTLFHRLKIELKGLFNDPDLVAIYRRGEEGHFQDMAETAWVAGGAVNARLLYVPDVNGGDAIFSTGGSVLHAVKIQGGHDLGLSAVREGTWYRSAAVTVLGEGEQPIGSLVLAWRQKQDILLHHPNGRIEKRREAYQKLDPFVHLEFLAMIGRDLTNIFTNDPLLAANYLL